MQGLPQGRAIPLRLALALLAPANTGDAAFRSAELNATGLARLDAGQLTLLRAGSVGRLGQEAFDSPHDLLAGAVEAAHDRPLLDPKRLSRLLVGESGDVDCDKYVTEVV